MSNPTKWITGPTFNAATNVFSIVIWGYDSGKAWATTVVKLQTGGGGHKTSTGGFVLEHRFYSNCP